jgi:hypothetical protein
MKTLIATLAALALSSCYVHTHSSCRTDCWYTNGQRVCHTAC